MALGAGVMLFAHWLYLIAAVLDMFAEEPSNEDDNVHERGQKMIASSGKRVDSSLEMIDSTLLSTKAPSNPLNLADSPTRVPNARDNPLVSTRRGSSLIGLTRQGSTLRSLNRQESATLLQSLSNQRDSSIMPVSVRLAESFLEEQLQSHLHDLQEGIGEDSEEMLQPLQA
jgi:hypothetical protein